MPNFWTLPPRVLSKPPRKRWMMFYCLLKLAPKKRANLVVKCAALTAIIGWVLIFNACSGASGIGTKSIGTGNHTASGLTFPAALPQASFGSSYSGSLTASGGTAPYTFALVSGQMPQGVSLADSTGTISGTPTTSGNFSFGVSVSDSKEASKYQSLVVTVANATTASTPAPTSPPPAYSSWQGVFNTYSGFLKSRGLVPIDKRENPDAHAEDYSDAIPQDVTLMR